MARPTLLALALVALFAIAAARVPFKRVAQFQEWKAQYGKSYATPSEEAYRLNVFHENMNFIEGHDAEEKGFTVGTAPLPHRPMRSASLPTSPAFGSPCSSAHTWQR